MGTLEYDWVRLGTLGYARVRLGTLGYDWVCLGKLRYAWVRLLAVAWSRTHAVHDRSAYTNFFL